MKKGMSMKTRLIFLVILVAFAVVVASQAFSVLENQGSFIKDCNYTEQKIQTQKEISTRDQAIALLGQYANTSHINYDKYPLEYLCSGVQYYFEDNLTKQQFYVCTNGLLIKRTPDICKYNFDFGVVSQGKDVLSQK